MTLVPVMRAYGAGRRGNVKFAPRGGGGAVVSVVLDGAGSIATSLPDTDEGWTYAVTEQVSGQAVRRYDIEVPSSAGTIDLADLVTVDAAAGVVAGVTLAALTDALATYVPLNGVLRDTFTGAADAATLAGRVPVLGAPWLTTGAQGVGISGGYAASPGIGYMYAAGDPDVLACEVAWGGLASGAPMTMAWSSSPTFDLANLLHLNFGPQMFSLTARQDAVSFDAIAIGSWDHAMKTDGTVYRISVAVVGQRVIIRGPNGETFASPLDPRVASLRGSWVFWEPVTAGGSSAKLRSVAAYDYVTDRLDAYALPGDLGNLAASIKPNSVQGAPGKRHQVTIGDESTLKYPGVAFGAAVVLTRLMGAHAAGAAAIVTEYPMPVGSTVKIETGNGAETVTISASSPSAQSPYTHAISGTLAKAHADGVAVAGATPLAARAEMHLNPENGLFYLPSATFGIVLPGALFFGDALDAYVTHPLPGVVAFNGGSGGMGAVQTGLVSTAGRPAANSVGVGAQLFDTTLNRPIWSNGAAWRDAAGNAV